MAITYSNKKQPNITGRHKKNQVDLTFDNSYTTGGMAVNIPALGLSKLERLDLQAAGGTGATGWVVAWNRNVKTPKILAYRQNATTGALVEVAAATDLSTLTVQCLAVGG